MWSDNETEIDLLGVESLVDSLVEALSEPRLLPLTMGVLGDWGSGKSSLMALACAELNADTEKRYACVRFSPWQYEDYEDVKVALMAAVLNRLAEETRNDSEQAEEVGRLKAWARGFRRRGRRVVRGGVELLPAAVPLVANAIEPGMDPTLVGVAQQGVQTATAGISGRLADPAEPAADGDAVTDVEEFRNRFAALIESLAEVAAVVVFIDDLDRCLPETVVDTFEAIRLLLGAPRTAFVVAANQQVVESAIDARYPDLRGDGRTPGIGARYLEKMLQLKVSIPALAIPEAVTYINLLLADLHLPEDKVAQIREHVAAERATHALEVTFDLGIIEDLGIDPPAALVADLQWASAIAPVLAAGSRGNPRQIKQFLNTLELRRRAAKRRGVSLAPAVLAKLMLLESQHIDAFQRLFDWQVSSGGPGCPQLAAAEQLILAPDDSEAATTVPDTEPAARAKTSRAKPKATEPTADDEVRTWATREPVTEWLRLPPRLSGTDLRAYFTYSRDRLSLDNVTSSRMSGQQRRLLDQILAATDAVRRAGLDALAAAEPADQTAIVDALSRALLITPNDAFVAVCETVDRLPQTRDVLLPAMKRLPPAAVPAMQVVTAAARLPRDDARTTALLDSWADSGRTDLARMVALARRGGGRRS